MRNSIYRSNLFTPFIELSIVVFGMFIIAMIVNTILSKTDNFIIESERDNLNYDDHDESIDGEAPSHLATFDSTHPHQQNDDLQSRNLIDTEITGEDSIQDSVIVRTVNDYKYEIECISKELSGLREHALDLLKYASRTLN